MYTCIGKKLKGLAIAMFIILAIAAIACGFVFGNELDSGGAGFLIFLSGAFIAWLSSWVLYGFGELIDKVCSIESALKGSSVGNRLNGNLETAEEYSKRIEELTALKENGYITEEEFQQAMEKGYLTLETGGLKNE